MKLTSDRFRGCLLGLAVGDAVGTTVEFQPRGTFPLVTDMTGGGPFDLKPGEWTDDTSMALCLGTSLLHVGSFDTTDQMNRYVDWMDNGYLSSNGKCFDIGTTTYRSLARYKDSGESICYDTNSNRCGNGSIMRLAPVPMFYATDLSASVMYSGDSSMTTHSAMECIDACRYLGFVLSLALRGVDKREIITDRGGGFIHSRKIKDIAGASYTGKTEDDIRSSGYVVDTLEAALWSFWVTCSFEEAILKAVNLGDDADTVGAVCGQIAGAFYGEAGIPRRWLKQLVMYREIRNMSDRLGIG